MRTRSLAIARNETWRQCCPLHGIALVKTHSIDGALLYIKTMNLHRSPQHIRTLHDASCRTMLRILPQFTVSHIVKVSHCVRCPWPRGPVAYACRNWPHVGGLHSPESIRQTKQKMHKGAT